MEKYIETAMSFVEFIELVEQTVQKEFEELLYKWTVAAPSLATI